MTLSATVAFTLTSLMCIQNFIVAIKLPLPSTTPKDGPKGPSMFYFQDEDDQLAKRDAIPNAPSHVTEASLLQSSRPGVVAARRSHVSRSPIKLFRNVLNFLRKHSPQNAIVRDKTEYYFVPKALIRKSGIETGLNNPTFVRKKIREDGRRLTQILTKKYLVSIITRNPVVSQAVSSDRSHVQHASGQTSVTGKRRSFFVLAPDKDDEDMMKALTKPSASQVHESKNDDTQPASRKGAMETVAEGGSESAHARGAKSSEISKLPEDKDDNYIITDDAEEAFDKQEHLYDAIRRSRRNKKKLTKLFVHFMEDMASKLHLNPLSIAEGLIRKESSASKKGSVPPNHQTSQIQAT